MAPHTRLTRAARWPARRLRRSFVPEYEDLLAQTAELRRSLKEARAEIAGLRADQADARAQLTGTQDQVRVLDEGLAEARRLSFRLGQLTDVVTEVVLPLHHRDIDPAVFDGLARETS